MTQTTATSPYRSLDNHAGNNDLLDMLLDKSGMKNDAALALSGANLRINSSGARVCIQCEKLNAIARKNKVTQC